MSTSCCNLEGFCLFALLVNMNQLTWLYTERRTVDSLSIDKNVAVNYQLT
jgi:hypothetical protein